MITPPVVGGASQEEYYNIVNCCPELLVDFSFMIALRCRYMFRSKSLVEMESRLEFAKKHKVG